MNPTQIPPTTDVLPTAQRAVAAHRVLATECQDGPARWRPVNASTVDNDRDVDRERSDYWYRRACQYADLIGAITTWAEAPTDSTAGLKPCTPTRALGRIRALLDTVDANQPEQATSGTDGDLD